MTQPSAGKISNSSNEDVTRAIETFAAFTSLVPTVFSREAMLTVLLQYENNRRVLPAGRGTPAERWWRGVDRPAKCLTCNANGSAVPFDANCPAAWAHDFVYLDFATPQDVPRVVPPLNAVASDGQNPAAIPADAELRALLVAYIPVGHSSAWAAIDFLIEQLRGSEATRPQDVQPGTAPRDER